MSKPYKFVPFPAVSNANTDGLLVAGGDLSLDTLLSAYQQGIFPWYNDKQPILWWSPNPRMVLEPHAMHCSHSLKKILRKKQFFIRCNQAFEQVITACAGKRTNQQINGNNNQENSTWINPDMQQAYIELHQQGYAYSIECWQQNDDNSQQVDPQKSKLVGGLYGVNLGYAFFGESMFSTLPNTSKIALFYLSMFLQQYPDSIIDCQVESPHLSSLGAKNIPRIDFLAMLKDSTPSANIIAWHEFESFCKQLVV